MTAEIVLLNREAVVMAADSAATVEERGVTKIYHSENKLFMLSKYRPIGVMIYNNVHLCGVPWETIIKEYRKEIKDANFETLREYADSFLNYLRDNQYLFSPDQQFDDNAHAIVRRLTELHKLYEREISQGTKRLAALGAVLDKKIIELQAKPYLAGFDR